MTLPPIELRSDDCQDLDAFLAERIYEFNAKTTGYLMGRRSARRRQMNREQY
jgi:hypothetical protein